MKAVLTIATKLSDRTLNGELLKHLAKTANDEQPGIRTNTTICLSKIARNLGVSTRQKVLVAAFARSLRDPFIHARNAALLALAATSDLFDEEDCANKILPILCPPLLDKEKLVRDQANKCFDVYLLRIRKFAHTMPDTILPPQSTTAANGRVSRMGIIQNDSTGWAGWAISSFTNKLGSASGDMESKPTNPSLSPSDKSFMVPPSIQSTQAHPSAASALDHHRQGVMRTSAPVVVSTPTENYFTDPLEEDAEIDEAWCEMAEDDSKDVPSEHDSVQALPVQFDDGGEPDFEGWLKAQTQTKSKALLPKGLVKQPTPTIARITTIGSLGSGAGSKKLASTASKPTSKAVKPISTIPKEVAEDDWGDAWD